MTIIKGKAYFDMPVYKDISDLFEQRVQKSANHEAITYRETPKDEPITLTYQEFSDNIDALRLAWSNRGLTNQKLAIVGANSYYWIASYLAAAKCQDMLIPLDNLLTAEELVQLLIRSKADMLCIDLITLLKFSEHIDILNSLKLIQVMNTKVATKSMQENYLKLIKSLSEDVEIIEFSGLIEEGKMAAQQGSSLKYQEKDENEPSILIFTSGTTAMSKGVLLTQKAITSDVAALHGIIDFPKRMRTLSMLPLNHAFESTCGMLGVISVGGHIHIYDGLRYVQKNLQEYQTQMFIGVPAIFDSFYNKIMLQVKKQNKVKKINFALKLSGFLRKIGIDIRRKLFKDVLAAIGNLEIAIIGAAPMKKDQIEFFDAIGIRVYEGYGLTETAPVAIANNDFVFQPGTIGQPLPTVEAKIDSDNPAEPGELLVRGPILMHSYYENEEATKEAFTEDGWFRTGDLGIYDEKTNTFKITGRKKSMIVLDSGKKVFPEEIESLIKAQQVAIIKDSMVFSQPTGNEQSVLSVKFVLNKLDEKLPDDIEIRKILDKLLQDINEKIPDFKRIKIYFYSYKDMISTSTLKVKREEEKKRLEKMKAALNLKWDQISKQNIDQFESK